MTTPVTPEDEYTPTTEEVRADYIDAGWGPDGSLYGDNDPAQFDRWLAAHDAKVRQSTPPPQPVQVDREAIAKALDLQTNYDRDPYSDGWVLDIGRATDAVVAALTVEADKPKPHECDSCADCLHEGNRCCGCYDGACCQPKGDKR